MNIEIGSLLVGVAALAGAALSFWKARKSDAKSEQALKTSPSALLEGLRTQVDNVLTTHRAAATRWQLEREELVEAYNRERVRAETGDQVIIELQAQQATMVIDLAAARAELADLRVRFEASLARPL